MVSVVWGSESVQAQQRPFPPLARSHHDDITCQNTTVTPTVTLRHQKRGRLDERRYARRPAGPSGCSPRGTPDDTPNTIAEWFAKASPAGDVLLELLGNDAAREMLKPKRGWPASAKPKEHVNIRLDADVVGAFKDSGAGWQTHINNALREWLKAPSEIPKG